MYMHGELRQDGQHGEVVRNVHGQLLQNGEHGNVANAHVDHLKVESVIYFLQKFFRKFHENIFIVQYFWHFFMGILA